MMARAHQHAIMCKAVRNASHDQRAVGGAVIGPQCQLEKAGSKISVFRCDADHDGWHIRPSAGQSSKLIS